MEDLILLETLLRVMFAALVVLMILAAWLAALAERPPSCVGFIVRRARDRAAIRRVDRLIARLRRAEREREAARRLDAGT